jgi:cytochrome P450
MPLNPLTAVTASDPYSYYRELVSERPFHWDAGLGVWVAASARAVEEALTNTALCVRPRGEPVPHAISGTAVGELFGHWARMTDGKSHDAGRSAACRHIDAVNFEALQTRSPKGETRINTAQLHTFAFTFPARTLAMSMGIEDSGATEWTHALVRAIAAGATTEDVARGCEAVASFRAAFGKRGITEAVSVANAIALLFQTYDATAALMGNSLVAFAAGDASRTMPLQTVVAEVARYDSPVQNTRRFAASDTKVFGTKIYEGDAVLVLLAAANRDPSANPEPQRFRIERADRRTYTFGVGPHACPGARIASAIARAGLEHLLESGLQLESLRVASYRPSPNIRMPDFEISSFKRIV